MAFGDVLKKFGFRDDYDEEEYEEEETAEEAPRSSKSQSSAGKVMSLYEKSAISLKIHRFKGTQWQETVKKAANDFKNGCSVLLNTEDSNKDATTRLLDFLGGVVYALDGKMVRFSTTGYAIVPADCEITGEIYDDSGYHVDSIFG